MIAVGDQIACAPIDRAREARRWRFGQCCQSFSESAGLFFEERRRVACCQFNAVSVNQHTVERLGTNFSLIDLFLPNHKGWSIARDCALELQLACWNYAPPTCMHGCLLNLSSSGFCSLHRFISFMFSSRMFMRYWVCMNALLDVYSRNHTQ